VKKGADLVIALHDLLGPYCGFSFTSACIFCHDERTLIRGSSSPSCWLKTKHRSQAQIPISCTSCCTPVNNA